MRQNLLETYARQLSVAETYVAKNFDGKQVSNNTKLTTAVLLDNTNRWLTESLDTMVAGGNRRDLGDWKKFCLNLTNIAVPSLIANDLVIVHPMTSYSGSVAYLEYQFNTDKNGLKGELMANPFQYGKMDENRMNYTSQLLVEEGAVPSMDVEEAGVSYVPEGEICVKYADVKAIFEDGHFEYCGKDEIPAEAVKIVYAAKRFQMNYVPAEEIPSIKPVMKRIPLVAEPRRIAVKYDQITAFQAKTDYGFSLDKQIAEQACGELAYEIDTEIVNMLYEGAGEVEESLRWSKTLPVGVSKFEHYNGFLEVIEQARTIIYKRTQKFHPNYMVVAADILPVLRFVNGFNAVKNAKMNGPYKVGELDNMAVYVSPVMAEGEFFFGLNGNDMMSSAGVYAPYMAIVPTQLLGTPDGGLQQGFSTWYAKALLNKLLLVKGKIEA